MSLIKKIKDYYKNNKTILFTTPSHSQGNFIIPAAKDLLGKELFKCDFSEIEGFDNLRSPKGIIKSVLSDISRIYDSKASFMLTNGSTSGMIAALMSVIKENDKVLIARNCHISVYNALVLTGAKPVWFLPDFDDQWGIFKGVKASDIKKYINENKDIKALVITSPTYEGVFSDIEQISAICAQNNIKLIVDEAHGALLNFYNFRFKPSIHCGADISIQSLHKTAGALNPCALLHISKKSDILPELVQENLNLINTTSPSYPLMTSIESTVKYLDSKKGRNHIKKLFNQIEDFKNRLRGDICFFEEGNDPSKLLIKVGNANAYEVSEYINHFCSIEEEYSNERAMLFITGIGTDSKKLSKLEKALKSAVKKLKQFKISAKAQEIYSLPQAAMTPKAAYNSKHIYINVNETEGRICAEPIVSYPPGIPVLIPGEVITLNMLFKIDKEKIKVCI